MKKANKMPVWGFDFCVIDKEVWIFHGGLNALFKYDLDSRKMEYILTLKEEKSNEKVLFISMHLWKQKLFFIPYKAENFMVYDMKSGKCTSICDNSYRIESTFGEKNNIYGKPILASDPIIKMDLELQKVIKEIKIPLQDIDEDKVQYVNDMCYMGDGVYAGIIYPANVLIIMDTKIDLIKTVPILDDNKFTTIEYCENSLYLTGLDKDIIIKVDPQNGKIQQYFQGLSQYGRFIGRWKNYIVIDLVDDAEMYLFDCQSGEIIEFNERTKVRINGKQNYWHCYGIFKSTKDTVYYLDRYNNSFIVWDSSTKNEELYEFELSDIEYEKLKEQLTLNIKKYEMENEVVGLAEFLKIIN